MGSCRDRKKLTPDPSPLTGTEAVGVVARDSQLYRYLIVKERLRSGFRNLPATFIQLEGGAWQKIQLSAPTDPLTGLLPGVCHPSAILTQVRGRSAVKDSTFPADRPPTS